MTLPSVVCLVVSYFTYYLTKGTNLGKMLLHTKCKFWFSLQLLFASNISHCKKNWARCDKKCISVLMWNTCSSCQIIMKIEFSQIFSKNTQLSKLPENQCSASRALPCRTDWQIDMKKVVVGFRNLANAPENLLFVLKHCLQCLGLCGSTRDTNRFPHARKVCYCWTGSHVNPLQQWHNSGMILIGFS